MSPSSSTLKGMQQQVLSSSVSVFSLPVSAVPSSNEATDRRRKRSHLLRVTVVPPPLRPPSPFTYSSSNLDRRGGGPFLLLCSGEARDLESTFGSLRLFFLTHGARKKRRPLEREERERGLIAWCHNCRRSDGGIQCRRTKIPLSRSFEELHPTDERRWS